ncbi:hypothetical protein LTR28_004272 [Elasticomyces elasticus]|nr:hypothetical protein LTR28_004272 [Elasticomyces elasticus]
METHAAAHRCPPDTPDSAEDSATAEHSHGSQPKQSLAADAPPFWQRHGRTDSTFSYTSIAHLRPRPIQLEDHSEEDHEQSRACWARHVTIDDYVVVSGNGTAIGSYVVFIVNIETLKGGSLMIRKRYSEFDALRDSLIDTFPFSAASIPELPRKSVISRFRPKFLEQRRAGLAHFLKCVLLNPEFSAAPVLKDFIFS